MPQVRNDNTGQPRRLSSAIDRHVRRLLGHLRGEQPRDHRLDLDRHAQEDRLGQLPPHGDEIVRSRRRHERGYQGEERQDTSKGDSLALENARLRYEEWDYRNKFESYYREFLVDRNELAKLDPHIEFRAPGGLHFPGDMHLIPAALVMLGVSLATVTGKIVAEIIGGQPQSRDLKLVDPNRYDKN